MKTTKASIEAFLSQDTIAMAGYSHNPKKFGHEVYKTLREKSIKVLPVNPKGGVTESGDIVYESLESLPVDVKTLLVITPKEQTEALVEKAHELGFTHLWVQQMSGTPKTEELLEKFPHAVSKECILKFTNPTGVHKFHWWLSKTFGFLPK
ncbi:MAG: CoA-binding protein [Bacteroidetes bacterium]|nr:MAG: CoA-binding protein [Bacteroidota bacterium]